MRIEEKEIDQPTNGIQRLIIKARIKFQRISNSTKRRKGKT